MPIRAESWLGDAQPDRETRPMRAEWQALERSGKGQAKPSVSNLHRDHLGGAKAALDKGADAHHADRLHYLQPQRQMQMTGVDRRQDRLRGIAQDSGFAEPPVDCFASAPCPELTLR